MEVRCRPQTDFPDEFKNPGWFNDPFKANWTSTLILLKKELEFLGASYAIIELAIPESAIKLDGWPKHDARATHQGVVISFDSEHGDLRYGTDKYPSWQSNVRAIALGLEALRKVERYGIAQRAQQYSGWAALPQTTDAMTPKDAEELLETMGGNRKALFLTHPDTRAEGYTDEDFRRVQRAREVLGLA